MRRGYFWVGGTVGALLLFTWVWSAMGMDLRVSALFFDPTRGWVFHDRQPWYGLYRYGTIPGIVFSAGALLGWAAGFRHRRLASWRPYLLLVVLTTVIGSGIIVNTVLKPYWGRPRPDQCTVFGGQWEYRDIHQPGTPGKGASFPSGHASIAFVFIVLYGFQRRSPRLALIGGTAGLGYGGLMSITRVVQGAHFAADTVWSLGVMALTAQVLYYFVLRIPARDGSDPSGRLASG
jgi:membrane-associated PAP2 superfamily phosphatase